MTVMCRQRGTSMTSPQCSILATATRRSRYRAAAANCGQPFIDVREMVLLGRIELPTSSLPMTRSTTELQQRLMSVSGGVRPGDPGQGRANVRDGGDCQAALAYSFSESHFARHRRPFERRPDHDECPAIPRGTACSQAPRKSSPPQAAGPCTERGRGFRALVRIGKRKRIRQAFQIAPGKLGAAPRHSVSLPTGVSRGDRR